MHITTPRPLLFLNITQQRERIAVCVPAQRMNAGMRIRVQRLPGIVLEARERIKRGAECFGKPLTSDSRMSIRDVFAILIRCRIFESILTSWRARRFTIRVPAVLDDALRGHPDDRDQDIAHSS